MITIHWWAYWLLLVIFGAVGFVGRGAVDEIKQLRRERRAVEARRQELEEKEFIARQGGEYLPHPEEWI